MPAMVRDSCHLYNPHTCSGTVRAFAADRAHVLDDELGPLERRVLESLWGGASSVSVRELQGEFPGPGLHDADDDARPPVPEGTAGAREGRPGVPLQPEVLPRRAHDGIGAADVRAHAGSGRAALRPVLSTLIDAVTEQDADALDELERLVRERRNVEREKGGDVMTVLWRTLLVTGAVFVLANAAWSLLAWLAWPVWASRLRRAYAPAARARLTFAWRAVPTVLSAAAAVAAGLAFFRFEPAVSGERTGVTLVALAARRRPRWRRRHPARPHAAGVRAARPSVDGRAVPN